MNQEGGAKVVLFKLFDMVPYTEFTDDDNNNILHQLVLNADSKLIYEFLISSKLRGNLKKIINSKNKNNDTPLHLAVKNKKQDIADILINFGANKNLKNNQGQKIKWVDNQVGGNKKIEKNINKKIVGKRYI
jgi:ankyrin repeat protein